MRIGGRTFWVGGGEWTFLIGGRGLMEVGGGISLVDGARWTFFMGRCEWVEVGRGRVGEGG